VPHAPVAADGAASAADAVPGSVWGYGAVLTCVAVGLPGVAAGLAVFGLAIGVDNVVSVTLVQRWAPPALSMAYGLTQREFRDFGTGDKEMLSADKGLSQADA
jgi:hypothetical protein